MQNELFVSMLRWSTVFSILRATVMVASLALLIECRPGCEFISICALVLPFIRLPLTCEPSVYTKACGFNFFGRVLYGVCLLLCVGLPGLRFLHMASYCLWCVRQFGLCQLMWSEFFPRIRG